MASISLRFKSTHRVYLPENAEVHLTESEDQICSLLDECASWINQNKGSNTECRIAGGWVRDKLLGMPCNDIDIALDSMMGVTFAENLAEFCSTVKKIDTDKIAKIESNPDRSKHLETARTTILGLELDFVNLRSEEYTENSRIPSQIAFGTPLQDALRRDITINALFYNIHSRKVEDYTEKGLDDLKGGIIRTPLPPRETFLDDPLRVLRCIRFASRFGFELSPDLQQSAQNPEIQDALRLKISRERVGEEIDKMMKGPDPLRSVQLIQELGLYGAIFHIPPSVAPVLSAPLLPSDLGHSACAILHLLVEADLTSLPPIHRRLKEAFHRDPSVRPRLYLASTLKPFFEVTYQDAKKKTHPAVEAAIRESLKLGVQNHYLDGIPALFSAASILKNPTVKEVADTDERVEIGLRLREKVVHNPHTGSSWETSLLFSLISELVPYWNATEDKLDAAKAAEKVNAYNKFISRIEEHDLPPAVDAKSILDGHQVVQILEAGRPGAWTGKVLAQVVEWQLANPEGTALECETWLRGENAAGKIQFDVAPPPRSVQGKRSKVATEPSAKKVKTQTEE